MTSKGDELRYRGASEKSSSIPGKVAQFYYAYGLCCSSYPVTLLAIAVSVALICWYPLIHLPLPGNSPFLKRSPNVTTDLGPLHFCYVQQVVLRAAVLPWGPDLRLGDAFRAPLYETFKLLDAIRNYEEAESSRNLGHVCLHVEANKRRKSPYYDSLPQYSCLVLSPANMWHQDVQQFAQDSSILTTIFNHHTIQKGKVSIAEMLFGMHLYDTGIKRYPLRSRQRVIQYAVTLFFKEYDKKFIDGLTEKLYTLYPLHQNETKSLTERSKNDTVLIHYPGEINYFEFVPITVTFFLLFLYYYFSVRKIELIKSKIGMAFTVLVTVLCSLSMTLGICFFFGLTLNLQGKEVFPYLVILVGIENVLVLTKSMVSTPLHLDVKIRIAQGLSKEGWSITKNLLLELTILTFGLFTFIPGIQEFCIFAIVGLLTDFFLQMIFFSTILALDIKKTENLFGRQSQNYRKILFQNQTFGEGSRKMMRSKSHPRLTSFPANVVAGQALEAQEKKIPKRIRLVNIWARTRFFQRAFMILMVLAICQKTYNSGILENFILNHLNAKENPVRKAETFTERKQPVGMFPLLNTNSSFMNINYVTHTPIEKDPRENHSADVGKLKHGEIPAWMKLSLQHWPAILKQYNISISGLYISLLPVIKLSHVISPEQAVLLRNPNEVYGEKFHWHALAAALDPIEFNNDDGVSRKSSIPQMEQPFYPTSPMEILLTTILCTISVIVLTYTFVVLYRCICSRNYAEWRASWFNEKSDESSDDNQVLLEAVPVVLEGHQQEIECLATDGNMMISSCLSGMIKVWDSNTGEQLATIDRSAYFSGDSPTREFNMDFDDTILSDYESGSPPSRDETMPSLPKILHRINTDFTNIKDESFGRVETKRYNFTESYRQLYLNHDILPTIRNRIKGEQWRKEVDMRSNTNEICSKFGDGGKIVLGASGKARSFEGENIPHVGKRVNFSREFSDSSNNLSCKCSPIWCMDYLDNVVVIGCADGKVEFWEATSAQLKCVFEDGTKEGVTNIKFVGSRIVAARLYGSVDFLQLQTYNQGRPIDWNFTCAYRRTHIRTGSTGSLEQSNLAKQSGCEEDVKCVRIVNVKAHQQPITCLDCEGGRVLTGSQDHTVKVFKLEDGNALYTLHGHCGPITCMFMDRINPCTSGTGSQDGMLCVWDLLTGTCMYNIQAHDGAIISLTYSASYVISLGTDERMCVWERFQGHLLNTINVSQTFSSRVVMLAPHLVVATRCGGLGIWDVRTGECVRTIALGRSPYVFIKQLCLLRDAVLCDYGNQLRLVRFPLITHKFD